MITEVVRDLLGGRARGPLGVIQNTSRSVFRRQTKLKTGNSLLVKGGAANPVGVFGGGISRRTYLGNSGTSTKG